MNQNDEFKPGYFDPETHEYCLKDPRTPMPWMHYLFNEDYVALLSITGGGYSFHESAKSKRLLRMRPNNVPMDRPGRYVYIRNNATGDFHAAGWAPVMKDLGQQSYFCRLMAGSMSIDSTYNGIATTLTYFVPPDDSVEVWKLTVRNSSASALDLSLFPFAELALYDAVNDRDNYQYTYNIMTCSGEGDFIFNETLYQTRQFLSFLHSSARVAEYECDREAFIGQYNTEANPRGVINGKLTNTHTSGGNACVAQRIPVALSPGEDMTIVFLFGVAPSRTHAAALAKKYDDAAVIDRLIASVRGKWQDLFSKFKIDVPDKDCDPMLNFWHPYQIRTTLSLSRGPSIYEGGINRGIGYRDSNQDTLGPVYQVPGRVKKMLVNLLRFQHADGHACHGFFPHTKDGYGDLYSDDHLWLTLAVTNYLKETGDFNFLEERLPYFNSEKEESVFDHLRRSVEYTKKTCGPHGIPLMLQADWNDCLQLSGPHGNSESVWTGMLYHRALIDLAELCGAKPVQFDAKPMRKDADAMRNAIYKHAWEGKWFIRAFDDDGIPIGSEKNKYAKIFLNTQSWSVYAGIARDADGKQAMDSVREMLDSEYGIALLAPAYREYSQRLGSISSYPPGLKENAGIFCHANTWAVIAECMLGRGDRAYEYYSRLLPTRYNTRAALHKAEPYVYSQVIAGKEHPDFGLARNSWLTGTASWMFIAFAHYILGIKPDYTGLVIDPCIPSSWSGYKAERELRGVRYSIEVTNPESVSCGVKKLIVNGRESDGRIVPFSDRNTSIKVVLGK